MKNMDVLSVLFPAMAVLSAALAALNCYLPSAATVSKTNPILVELFTSEGCSSCPPADKLLSELRRTQPNVIVLSEHVDYWNYLGWKDPFSTKDSTDRQIGYCQKLGVASPYTPQAVVDGKYQFVGSNSSSLQSAISQGAQDLTIPVNLQLIEMQPQKLTAKASYEGSISPADILFFLVQDNVIVNVGGGENGGRHLLHDGVVRQRKLIQNVKEKNYAEAEFLFPSDYKSGKWRVVALVERKNEICGATQRLVEVK
jgi:hypothetical protein